VPTGGMVSTVVLDGGHDVQESEHGLGSIGSVEFVGSIGSLGPLDLFERGYPASGFCRHRRVRFTHQKLPAKSNQCHR
jgi:hypothetical protein